MEDRPIFPAWSLDSDEVLKILETTRDGISEDDARVRFKHFGANTLPSKHRFTILGLIARQFTSPLIFILLAASGLTIFLGETVETVVIILAIVVNALLGFYQEYRAENALEKLNTYIRERAHVVRAGIEQEIDSSLLVPGDIIRVAYGSRVPADARILEENNLTIDESVLTGESLPVKKNVATLSEGSIAPERLNMAHAGTLVVEGYATAVVTATESHTEIGRIAELVSSTHDAATPLQRALARMAWYLFLGIAVLVVGIFFLGLSRGEALYDMLLMAAAISVGAVPEALPIALTVILAVGVERLVKHKGIIRNLAAAETLGSASIIMTDKTGTLTEANMRLVSILPLSKLASSSDVPHIEVPETEEARAILKHALWSTDVTIENPSDAQEEWRFAGRPFEVSIVRAASELGIELTPYLEKRTQPLLVFNSTNKFAIVHSVDGERFVVGAPDILLARSNISKDVFVAAEARVHAISSEGNRLLGVARLGKKHGHASSAHEHVTVQDAVDLEFQGVLVFKDPIRPDAITSVKKIEALGARVVMLTGDLKGTALSVARELGWDVNEGNVLTGAELAQLSDAELHATLPQIRIFARVTPEDKLRIGMLYKSRGEIVAMTGDGVNDAPSLKAVDIGVALGSGSDVAKSVADLVILDDNFKTIVAAIEEGRRILENIRKVFVYLVSTCLGEVFLIGGSLLAGLPLPLSALQIIWINFFSDSLPALSFAFDKHYTGDVEKRGSHAIFSRDINALTILIGLFSSIALFGLYWYLIKSGIEIAEARSTLFLCFSLYVLIIAFSIRHLHSPFHFRGLFTNVWLTASVVFGSLLTLATVTVPFLKNIFELVTPPLSQLGIVVVWLVFTVLLVESMKWVALQLRERA